MTTPILIEGAIYQPDGSAIAFVGQTAVLDFQTAAPDEEAGPFTPVALDDRLFVQRIIGRDGSVLAQVEPSRLDDFTVRFTLPVSAELVGSAKAADLTWRIVELLEGDEEDDIVTRPFSVRALRAGAPSAQLKIGPAERLMVRYVGETGLSAARQVKDAGLIEAATGDALANWLREPSETAATAAAAAAAAAGAVVAEWGGLAPSAAAILANAQSAAASAVAAAADRVQTGADRAATGADRTAILAIAASGDDAAAINARAARNANGGDFADRRAVLDNLEWQRRIGVGQVSSLTRKLADYKIDAEVEFGVVPDGTDKAANLALARAEHFRTGKEIHLRGTYDDLLDIERPQLTINTPVPFYVKDALSYAASFRRGVVIRGVGETKTVIKSGIVGAPLFDMSLANADGSEYSFPSFAAAVRGRIEGITAIGLSSQVNSDFVRLRSQWQFVIEDFEARGFARHGIIAECRLGDTDACNLVSIRNGRLENGGTGGGYALSYAADPGFNELGGLSTENVVVQYWGIDESLSITAIAKGATTVITWGAVAHNLLPANNDEVYLFELGGMVSLDTDVAETYYKVASVDLVARTFELRSAAGGAINSAALPDYSGGGYIFPRNPKSGALKQKCQIAQHSRLFLTLNRNVSIHERGEAGLGQDYSYHASTIENPGGIGRLCTGVAGSRGPNIHIYSNGAFGGKNRYGHLNDGVSHVIKNVSFRDAVLRATGAETPYAAVRVLGGNVDHDTIDYGDMILKQADYTGQKRLHGVRQRIPPMQFETLFVGATTIRFRPGAGGNSLVVMKARNPVGGGVKTDTGEILGHRMPSQGINCTATYPPYAGVWGAASAQLPVDTQFFGYTADLVYALGRYGVEWWPEAPVADLATGLPVHPTDRTRIFAWSICTSAVAGQYRTAAIGWCNPTLMNGWWVWFDATGAMRRKATRPTLAGGGDLDGVLV